MPAWLTFTALEQKWACTRTRTSGISPSPSSPCPWATPPISWSAASPAADKPQALPVVRSGDVLIMGGAGRMLFHGVRRVYPGTSPIPGLRGRYSLTFRKAL